MKSVLDNIGRAIRQSAGDSQLVTRASNKLLNLPPPPLSLSLFLSLAHTECDGHVFNGLCSMRRRRDGLMKMMGKIGRAHV